MELSTDRQHGECEGPIPLTAIRGWAADAGMRAGRDYERLKKLVWAMDSVYLTHRAAERKKALKKG